MDIDKNEINKLYIASRDLFKTRYEELKKTDDDKFFLIDALECELCANTLSLCLELFLNMEDSPSTETSCRSILEALSLRRMINDGCLDEGQIKNFKHQSSLLFYGNIFETSNLEKDKLLSDEEDAAMRKKIRWIVEDYQRAIDAYKKKYGDGFDESSSRIVTWDSLSFASEDLSRKKRKSFTSICRDYLKKRTRMDPSGTMYNRISLFAHPWYVDNLDDFNAIVLERKKDILLCYESARKFFSGRMDSIPDETPGIESDLATIGNDMEKAELIKSACCGLFDMAMGSNGHMSFTALCMRFLKQILFEMNILNGLGYPEIALSKFQTVSELWGINALINDTENASQWKAIQQAFDYSTRLQMYKPSVKADRFKSIPLKDRDFLKSAYDASAYKTAISFDEYASGIEKNSFLFLRPFYPEDGTTFLDLARAASNKTFLPNRPNRSKDFMLAYFFSIDVHHATGFCYTENRDCWALLSHEALIGIYESLLVFSMFVGISSDSAALVAGPIIQRITKLVDDELAEIKVLSLKYPECQV